MNRSIVEKAQKYFTTGVSLITSSSPHGQNVMAAEWTMQISYEPMLIAIFIHEGNATFKNIKQTREFGINVSSEEQTMAVNIAGGYSRKEIDKLKIKDAFDTIPSKNKLSHDCRVYYKCRM